MRKSDKRGRQSEGERMEDVLSSVIISANHNVCLAAMSCQLGEGGTVWVIVNSLTVQKNGFTCKGWGESAPRF